MSKGQRILFIALLSIYLLVLSILFYFIEALYPMLVSLFFSLVMMGQACIGAFKE